MEICCVTQGPQTWLSNNLEGRDAEGGGRDVQVGTTWVNQ